MVEPLEDRTLLSTIDWSVATGVLTVNGDSLSNTIKIVREGTNLKATVGSTTRTVSFSSVRNVNLLGNGGNDTITVDSRPGSVIPTNGVRVDGGTGADTLVLPDPNTSATLTVPGPVSTSTSKWTYSNGRALEFTKIERQSNNGIVTSMKNAAYVEQSYVDVLGRAPEFGGVRHWTNLLNVKQAQGVDPAVAREEVARELVYGTEYRQLLVRGYYLAYLGRDADPVGLALWVDRLRDGAFDEQVQAGILGSDEYYQRNGPSSSAFINALFRDLLSRTPSPSEMSYFLGKMSAGVSRENVALEMVADLDPGTPGLEYNQNLIQSYYRHYLRRQAGPSEIDIWIQAYADGLRNEDVIAKIVGSQEYYNAL